MKLNKRKLLEIMVLLALAAAVIFYIGRNLVKQNEAKAETAKPMKVEASMESRSYTSSDIDRIEITTDTAAVVFEAVTDSQLGLSWQEDQYTEFSASLKGGVLTVEYTIKDDFLASLTAMLASNEYVLTVRLPDSFAGTLNVSTASGRIDVGTDLALKDVKLSSISGSIDAQDVHADNDVALRTTSGSIRAEAVQAGDDMDVQTISGSVKIQKSTVQGNVKVETGSGSINLPAVTADQSADIKTISGSIEVSDMRCADDVTLESTSGTIRLSGVVCDAFRAQSVSAGITAQSLDAQTIDFKSVSGSITASVSGAQSDYSITAKTVSGNSNITDTPSGRQRKLTADTVSGGIKISFVAAD